jgi:type I restriction enzyme S subunit
VTEPDSSSVSRKSPHARQTQSRFTAAKVLIPPRPLLDAMTRTMSPLIDQLIANRIQSRTLATLRDTLLPRLLSGELSVAEVGKEIPE